MGILNLTPDSFYDGGLYDNAYRILQRAEQIIKEGGKIIDIGGMSSRPGSKMITVGLELKRVLSPIQSIRKRFPSILISIDTLHSKVAQEALEQGVNIINDISGGLHDINMPTIAMQYQAPLMVMHMKGQPENMQKQTIYPNGVTMDVMQYFIERINTLEKQGVRDIIIDPGFGFGKTIEQNYVLFNALKAFQMYNRPVMVGISRKSMINRVLDVQPEDALTGSIALHYQALLSGVHIFRVHDVQSMHQIIQIHQKITHPAI